MTGTPREVWFVRTNHVGGLSPVSAKGWYVVLAFLAAMAVTALLAAWLTETADPPWLGFVVFAAGVAGCGGIYLLVATAHADWSQTLTEYRANQKGQNKP